jgi:hypothetical protein
MRVSSHRQRTVLMQMAMSECGRQQTGQRDSNADKTLVCFNADAHQQFSFRNLVAVQGCGKGRFLIILVDCFDNLGPKLLCFGRDLSLGRVILCKES